MRTAEQDVRDAAFDEIDRKKEAVRSQKRRLEWAIFGSTRDLSKFTQQQPVQVDNLIATLEEVLVMAREYRDAKKAVDALDEDEMPF